MNGRTMEVSSLTECVLIGVWICFKETLSWSIPCGNPTGGANDTTVTTTTTPCDTTLPNLPRLPDERGPEYPDEKLVRLPTIYMGLICIGIAAIPLAVCLKICWIKRLRGRQERTITDLRRQHSPVVEDYPPEIYTIAFDGVPVDNVYSPPDYFDNPAWCKIEAPPPYDQPPPEYKGGKDAT